MDKAMEQMEALAEYMEEERAALPTQVDIMHHSMEAEAAADIMKEIMIQRNHLAEQAIKA